MSGTRPKSSTETFVLVRFNFLLRACARHATKFHRNEHADMKVTARKNATFESTEPLKNMCLLYLRASNLPNFKRNTVSFLYNQLFAQVDSGD